VLPGRAHSEEQRCVYHGAHCEQLLALHPQVEPGRATGRARRSSGCTARDSSTECCELQVEALTASMPRQPVMLGTSTFFCSDTTIWMVEGRVGMGSLRTRERGETTRSWGRRSLLCLCRIRARFWVWRDSGGVPGTAAMLYCHTIQPAAGDMKGMQPQ
jgi:hypothetical protein